MTICGLSVLLSAIERLAVRLLTALGVNVIPILHVLPAATLFPQGVAVESAKSAASAPVKVNVLTAKSDAPVFVRTTVCTGLVVFTRRLPKLMLAGSSMTAPVEIVMVAETDFVLSETDVAVSVTGPLAGREGGAV
jgi:hypothetical protein